jgi:uncharacterized membrane protein YkoI
MKQLTGLLVFLLLTGNIFAQEISQNNVPAVVLNAFQVKYGNASNVEWRLEKGNYRVKFEVNSKDHELKLDDRGKIVKHEQDLYVSEIPKVVLETIQKKVPFFDVEDADKITENGKTTFEINFEIDGKDHDFWIDEKGILLKYEKELKRNEIPELIWSHITTNFGNLDLDNAELKEENGKVIYHLRGEINDMDHEFIFTEKAKIIKHNQDLRKNEIPAVILTTINQKYQGYEIHVAELKEDSAASFYDIQLRKSKEKVTLTFNPKGEIMGSAKKQ